MNSLLERTRALYPARKDLKDGLHRHPELSCCPSPRCHVPPGTARLRKSKPQFVRLILPCTAQTSDEVIGNAEGQSA